MLTSKVNMFIFSLMSFSLFMPLMALIGFWYYKRVGRMGYYLDKCPGIPRMPFLGNISNLSGSVFKGMPPEITICKEF